MNLAIQKEKEDPQLMEGIKDLLKESYHLAEDQMILIIIRNLHNMLLIPNKHNKEQLANRQLLLFFI